jgi:hypothetical protein
LIGQGCRAACAAVLALLVLAGTAHAADPWRPVPKSCVGASSFGVCSVTHSNSGLWKAVVAPGGTHAYGLAWTNHTLVIMDRDPATGAITQRAGAAGCVTSDPQDTVCSRATALINPSDVVISPDGAQVYVVGGTAVTVFDRDPSTGRLTQKPGIAGCLAADASTGCAVARATSGSTLMMSADGRHLYTHSSTIGIFQRDLATGTLTQAPDTAGCVANGGTGAGPADVRAVTTSARPAGPRCHRTAVPYTHPGPATTPSSSSAATRSRAHCARRPGPRAVSVRWRAARRSRAW